MQKNRGRRKIGVFIQNIIQEQQEQILRAPSIIGVFRIFFWVFVAVTSLIGSFVILFVVLVRAMHQEGWRDRIRSFNKRRLNPLVLHIAGNRSSIFATIKHVGRRSGKEYSTPIVVGLLGDGFVIPLSYGPDVDWCRNVLAAGSCKLLRNEQEYVLERPEIIVASQVRGAFPFLEEILFTAGGIEKYLWLHQHKEAPEKMELT